MAQSFDISVTVLANRLPQLRAQGKRRASRAVRVAAHNTWRFSRPIARKDTGAMATNVIIDVTGNGLSATVRWGQFYSVFQNMGTSRGITPNRFAEGGAQAAFPMFQRDMSQIYGGGT